MQLHQVPSEGKDLQKGGMLFIDGSLKSCSHDK